LETVTETVDFPLKTPGVQGALFLFSCKVKTGDVACALRLGGTGMMLLQMPG
jgi:hypothetical protein